MKILVVGANSYVGAAIYTQLREKYEVVGTYNAYPLFEELIQLDITHAEEVEQIIQLHAPDTIVHVASNSNGNWCDQHPELAYAINVQATQTLVELANTYGAKLVYISSLAATQGNNVYGKTKAAAEHYVQQTKAGFLILRPSLLVGFSPNTTNDRPFNRLLKNITHHTPAVYDTSWQFQPTWLRHLCEVIEQCISQIVFNHIIPITVPQLCTRYSLAKDILSDFGVTVLAEDKKDTTPLFFDTQDTLHALGLPVYSYQQMIDGIKEAISNFLRQ